jgi:exopolysaccharide production protein ExoQ
MHQSPHALTLSSLESTAFQPPVLSADRHTSILFLIGIFLLSFFAFMEPLEYAWSRPTYDESQDDERSEVGAREGNSQRQLTLGCMGLLGAAALVLSRGATLRVRSLFGVICVSYVAWCAASLLWTDDLSMSVRREIALACEIVAAIAIATRTTPRQFAWHIFACTFAWLGLGIIAEVSQGALQLWQAGYRFKGIFHPNIMSISCALLSLSSLYLAGGMSRGFRRLLYFVAAVAFVFLALTGSRTALGAFFASFVGVSLITVSTPKKYIFIGLTAFALLFVAAAQFLDAFDVTSDLVSMGRQDHDAESLSSRIPLWQELLGTYVPQRPLQGYGYGAFWTPARITAIERTQGWNAPYAHCTYIDLLLSIGIVGTSLFALAMLWTFLRSAWLETRHPYAGYGFLAMVIGCVLVDGAMETTFGATMFMSFFGLSAVCFILAYNSSAPRFATVDQSN